MTAVERAEEEMEAVAKVAVTAAAATEAEATEAERASGG